MRTATAATLLGLLLSATGGAPEECTPPSLWSVLEPHAPPSESSSQALRSLFGAADPTPPPELPPPTNSSGGGGGGGGGGFFRTRYGCDVMHAIAGRTLARTTTLLGDVAAALPELYGAARDAGVLRNLDKGGECRRLGTCGGLLGLDGAVPNFAVAERHVAAGGSLLFEVGLVARPDGRTDRTSFDALPVSSVPFARVCKSSFFESTLKFASVRSDGATTFIRGSLVRRCSSSSLCRGRSGPRRSARCAARSGARYASAA